MEILLFITYTERASTFQVNGKSVLIPKDRQPFYVIFDSGVTRMLVSQELGYAYARENREKSLWGKVVGLKRVKQSVYSAKICYQAIGKQTQAEIQQCAFDRVGALFFRMT